MAFGDIVQYDNDTACDKTNSLTLSYGVTPTSGNLLLCCAASRATTLSGPSGWSEAVRNVNASQSDDSAIYYKIAGASESTDVTFTDDDAAQRLTGVIYEVEGAFAATPFDKSGASSPNASVTNEETGSTGTLSQADEFAMALCAIRGAGSSDPDSPSIDSSFTYGYTGGNYTSGTFIQFALTGYRVVSATTALNPSFSWTNSLEAWGCIATFKKSVAAGDVMTPLQRLIKTRNLPHWRM